MVLISRSFVSSFFSLSLSLSVLLASPPCPHACVAVAVTFVLVCFIRSRMLRFAPAVGQVLNGDRPHLLFDKDGTTPIALTTAEGSDWGAPGMASDQAYTFLRPLNR